MLADGTAVDARPSDAIALALVTGAPLLVDPDVLDERRARRTGVGRRARGADASTEDRRVLADEVRERSVDGEDELAAHVAVLEALVRVGGALEREGLLDVRAQAALGHQRRDVLAEVVAARAHEDVADLVVAVARLGRRLGDRDQAPAGAQRRERLLARVAAEEVERRVGARSRPAGRARARGGRSSA